MKRRSFIKHAGLWALAGTARAGAATDPDECQPNILLIMTDQQSAEAMSCAIGNDYIRTPNIDALAAQGMRFIRAYCPNPLCVPARTSIFTGHYPHQTGLQTNSQSGFKPDRFTCMGKIFRQAGYDTGYVGKWHIPFNKSRPDIHGFNTMVNIRNNGADNASPEPALEFLNRARQQPFLLVTSFVNPHNICEWARGDNLPDGSIGEAPAASECPPLRANSLPPQNETDVMEHMRRAYQKHRLFPVGDFDEDKWRRYAWAYYRMVEMVDRHVGTILEGLHASGQAENTLILFTSDHGDCQGAHRWNQKTVFYDESSRVPFILALPGVTCIGISDQLVQTGIDIIPTLCDFAGIPIPETLPGQSLRDIACGETGREIRPYLVISNKMVQCEAVNGVKWTPSGRMVRSRRFKYCLYSEGRRRESLVDMVQDPGETKNLALTPDTWDILLQHRAYLQAFAQEHDDQEALAMLSVIESRGR